MGMKSINEIVNDSMEKLNKIKFNDINESMRSNKTPMISKTEYIADKLVDIYNAPRSRNFFLKCAWHLSEDTIWSAVEDTRKEGVKEPIALFIFICTNALKEIPVKS